MPEESTDVPDVVETAETEATEAVVAEQSEAEDEFAEVKSLDAVPEAPEEEPEAQETSEDDAQEDEGEAEEGEAEEIELVEFNFGGNKLEVKKGDLPPELEARVQEFSDKTWSDYTKGKQAVAEEAKQIASEREAVMKMTTLNGEALQTYSRGLQVRQELEQLSQVDLNLEWQSNPDRARQISDTIAGKQAELSNIIDAVGKTEQAMDQAKQDDLVRRKDEGRARLDSRIKDFTTTHAPEVVKYAVEMGMSQSDADGYAMNPIVAEMGYKAMMYDRMQAKATKPKSRPAQTKPVVPMKTAGKSSPGKTDVNKMSFRELGKHLGIPA